ncbi:MAG: substrate-binding domain-containing protein [Chlorobi bacterium]|nr:substrate-binding domain-containing protein [Chlorobiota bacterium]
MEDKKHMPIYKRLVNSYMSDIYSGRYLPGQQIDSINKIISKHKVSRETAKIVLKNLAEAGLIVQILGKGSFVKAEEQKVNKWGVILPLYSANMEQLIGELLSVAHKKGMELEYYLHYNNPDEEMRLVSSLIQKGYDSLFIVPNFNEALTADYYNRLRRGNTKIFLVDNTMAGSAFNYVIQSYDLGVKRAAEYLAGQNKGNFLFVKDPAWSGVNMVAESMFSTFTHYGETIYNRKVLSIDHHKKITPGFIVEHRIGGILCYKDVDSIRILRKLKDWKIDVPGRVSVVNYGNTELLVYFNPGITAVDCCYGEMTRKLEAMYERCPEDKMEQHVILPKLIIRET